MAQTNRNNDIDDIVSGVHEALKNGEISVDNLRLEFTEEEESAPALVFEDDEETEEKKTSADSESASDAVDEASESGAITEEEPVAEQSPKIWTTYVPRFTEVSETYRMKGEDSSGAYAPTVRSAQPDSHTDEPEVDPTAEIENEAPVTEARVVASGNPTLDEGEEISTVFKFSAPVEEPASAQEAPIAETNDEIEAAEECEDEPCEEPEIEESSEEVSDGEYSIPDPMEKGEAELPVAATAAPVPELVDESIKKKKSSEYTSFSEREGLLDKFIDSMMALRVRLIAAAVIALMLLFVENVSVLGVDLVKNLHFDGVNGAMAIINLPFVVGLFLLALPEIVYSFMTLTGKRLIPEIMLTLTFGVICLYYVLVIAFSPSAVYPLFGFVFALIVITALLAAYLKKKADFIAFKLVSKNGEKRVVDRRLTRNLPEENRTLDGRVETYKSRTARVFRTNFVSDFSARSALVSENTPNNLFILTIAFGIALVTGLVAFFIPGGIFYASVAFATVFCVASPMLILLTHKLPYYVAMRTAESESSAVIGEQAFFDYSGVDVVTFDDTEIFGKEDVNLQRIMVYGRKENLPKALQQMSALFTVVGGPLAYIFANALDRRVSPADNVRVELDGIIGEIDGVEVTAGTAEFMEGRGMRIPHDPTNDSAILHTTRIMYASEGGEIYAKFYIRYVLSEEFTMILPSLTDEGIIPLVYTRDPNINEELFRSLTVGSDSISVLKKQNLPANEVRLYQRISLGMVTEGDKINVINSLLLARKYTAFQSKMAIAELAAMISGAAISLVLFICKLSMLSASLFGLWHVAWCAALALFARKALGVPKDKNKNKEAE